MAYPVSYSAALAEDRSRLTTFFRYFLAIPHLIVAMFYAFFAIFTVVGAWFAVVITGRYPDALYRYNGGFLQYVARVNGYVSLVTDAYPPFGIGDADHPIRMRIADPQPEYSRARAFFRIVLMIPVYVIAYVLQIVGFVITVVTWFWVVITGRQLPALHSALVLTQAYNLKAFAYYVLITETWPPFSEDGDAAPRSDPPTAQRDAFGNAYAPPTAAAPTMPPPPPPPA